MNMIHVRDYAPPMYNTKTVVIRRRLSYCQCTMEALQKVPPFVHFVVGFCDPRRCS